MTEQHLGDHTVRIFRDEESYCVWLRHGIAHRAHEWNYARTDPISGQVVTGSITCVGVTDDDAGKPFPLAPFDLVERSKAIDTLLGLVGSLPIEHPERPGVMRAIEVLRHEKTDRSDS